MWNTLNEHATCHKRDSVPSPPWYAPGLVATSNEPLDLNTFQGLVVAVAVVAGLVLPRITAQHALDSSYIWTNMTCTHSDLVLAARS